MLKKSLDVMNVSSVMTKVSACCIPGSVGGEERGGHEVGGCHGDHSSITP